MTLRRRLNRLLLLVGIVSSGAPVLHAQAYTFQTFVGSSGGPGAFDGMGADARFRDPSGIAIDGDGNLYIADVDTIRKVSPTGVVTTLAGMAGVEGDADGTGSEARFRGLAGVAVDPYGNVYVSDGGNNTIRKVTPSGAVTTIAGAAGTWGTADGYRASARFFGPAGLALDVEGNLYVADQFNHTLRRITPSGQVTTVAGTPGVSCFESRTCGEGRFHLPWGVVIDGAGDVYVSDNTSIRKVTPAGVVSSFAGLPGTVGAADGQGTSARFYYPRGLSIDSSGYIYVADQGNNAIRKISPSGYVTTLAGTLGARGSADGTGPGARFLFPNAVAVDSAGNVFVNDGGNDTLRKVTGAGVVTTLAGRASERGFVDGSGDAARFDQPMGVAYDSSGNLFIVDSANHTIRKVTPGGIVTTLAGSAGQIGSTDGTGSAARFRYPRGVATDSSDNLYVADSSNHTIRKVTPAGVVTTLAGSPGIPGASDGTGSAARFNNPIGVAVDAGGNVYVGDWTNNTLRKITPAGVVTTLAGLAGTPGTVDGTGSEARFGDLQGVAVDSSGNVYVADVRIRRVTPVGVVTTVAAFPASGIAVDASGNLFTCGSYTIRKIDGEGNVTTVGGLEGTIGSADGTGSDARFYFPRFIAVSAGGDLVVTDQNHRVRRGQPSLAGSVTVDDPEGFIGVAHQLGFSGTASTYDWRVVRKPSTSAAMLSSESSSSPTFTPDVADRYEVLLVVSNGSSSYIGSVAIASPRVFASSVGVSEASTGSVIVVNLSEAHSSAVTVEWSTQDGSATSGLDYVAAGGSLTFAPGQTSKPVDIPLLGDSIDEEDETFFVRLTNVSGAQAGASGTITVIDDDPEPSISIDDVSVFESDNRSTMATFTVTLSSESSRTVFCWASTGDGTAKAGTDYVALSSTKITFQPGETSQTISVEIVGDDFAEQDETFFVNLWGAAYATIEDPVGACTILNEDIFNGVAPSGLAAEATGTTQVALTWNALAGATYRVYRSDDGSTWMEISTSVSNAFVDSTVSAGKSYLYRVRAVDGPIESIDSSPDLATTVLFTNAELTPGSTTIKVDHISDLRAGVNAVRQLAGLTPAAFTDSTITTSTHIKRIHVIELRAALDEARSVLGLASLPYTDSITAGVTWIKALHIQEIRDRVR